MRFNEVMGKLKIMFMFDYFGFFLCAFLYPSLFSLLYITDL